MFDFVFLNILYNQMDIKNTGGSGMKPMAMKQIQIKVMETIQIPSVIQEHFM